MAKTQAVISSGEIRSVGWPRSLGFLSEELVEAAGGGGGGVWATLLGLLPLRPDYGLKRS